ncbi:MAG: VWA domain-containing protein [Candidatus Magnetominusculus sp. LBB02]|nr:VWA domain-containing protein [Candidatus Magnetominusculus sp. LBB02]
MSGGAYQNAGIGRKVRAAVFFSLMLCYSFAFGGQREGAAASLEISDISVSQDGRVSLSAAVADSGGQAAGLKKDRFAIDINGKSISEFSLKQTSPTPTSLIILVDVSGSMKGVPIVEAKKIITQLMGYLKEDDYAALTTFGVGVNKTIGFTKDKDIIAGSVDGLRAVENRTVLFKSVIEAVKQAASSPTGKSAILLITDSKDDHSDIDEDEVIAAAKQSPTPIYTVALGEYDYIGILRSISRHSGGQFFLFPKYDDIAHLAASAISGQTSTYVFEFPYAAPQGKYTAAVKVNYGGVEIAAKKEFAINATREETKPPTESPKPVAATERPATGQPTLNLLLLAVIVILVAYVIVKIRRQGPRDEVKSEDIKKLQTQAATTADMLNKMELAIKTVSDKTTAALSAEIKAVGGQISAVSGRIDEAAGFVNDGLAATQTAISAVATQNEAGLSGLKNDITSSKDRIIEKTTALTAALSAEIKAVGGQISAVSRQIDNTLTAMKSSVTDLLNNLKDASATKYQQEFANLKTEISALEGILSSIMSKQIEHFERQSTGAALYDASSIDETLYKDNIAALELIEGRLNEIESAVTALDSKIIKSTAQQSSTGTAVTNKINALEEKIAGIPGHLDTSIDAMKYSIADLVNTIMDIEKAHGLPPGQTLEKIESQIIGIENSITLLAAEIKRGAGIQKSHVLPAKAPEPSALEAIVSDLSRQMEGALYAVKDSITGMESAIKDASFASYAREIGNMRKDVASVRDALAEVMRFLLILTE